MCFSASVSYLTAVVLLPTGLYAIGQSRRLPQPYWMMGAAPLFFGVQQACEGRVWQLLSSGETARAVPFALGFHFFSHFLWLWWIPLSSAFVETAATRKRLFISIAVFGFFVGGLVFTGVLLHPEWLKMEVVGHSLVYTLSSPFHGSFHLPVPASALYALVILVPLLASSHRHVRIFGGLVTLSIALASAAWAYAFVSVWCFFAAVLSLYFIIMIRRLAPPPKGVAPLAPD